MATAQPGIFALGTRSHYHLEFDQRPGATPDDVRTALHELREPSVTAGGANIVVGFGPALARHLLSGDVPPLLEPFAAIDGLDGHTAPATQHDVWTWIHGTGEDIVLDTARAISAVLAPVAILVVDQPCFVYRDSRDLTGFIDGSANPTVDEAHDVAIIADGEPGAGGSVVLAQRWVHDLEAFGKLSIADQERVFGRTKVESIEFADEDKPPTAHIARVEIEVDGEELPIYRRSTPYGTVGEHGLYFLAFSADQRRYDVMLERMFGVADGVRDQLTDFSRPVSGAHYFAPSLDALGVLLGDA